MRLAVVALAMGCSVPTLDFTGKTCPCPGGYACDSQTNTCARSLEDARENDGHTSDGTLDSHAVTGMDAPPPSCLGSPLTNLVYSSPAFADFDTAWTAGGVGETWSVSGGEAVQASASSNLALLYHTVSGNNYREVATMFATSQGDGLAIEVGLRIDAPNVHMYHCNWEPSDGAFLIMRTDNINTGITIATTNIDVALIPYMTPQTIEFQIVGSTLSCCIHGLNGASLVGTDTTYTSGTVGLKTYDMAGHYYDYAVYQ